MDTRTWQNFERDVQQLLGLDSTPASGSQFYAPGDAVDNRHPAQSRFPIMADCKATEKASFTLNHQFLITQTEIAAESGKRFIMPLRFVGDHHVDDYVVLKLDDFAEVLEQNNRRCAGCS